ncbi:hypothetical protein BJ170DRAFT_51407 [Xylariales sp. AK1849]|nr:hypothetical protein BJ170DRAFT_51407 [Xylariales sp. AK1849]
MSDNPDPYLIYDFLNRHEDFLGSRQRYNNDVPHPFAARAWCAVPSELESNNGTSFVSRHSRRRKDSSSSSNATRSTAPSSAADTAASSRGTDRATAPSTRPSTRAPIPREIAGLITGQPGGQRAYILPCEFVGYAHCNRLFDADDTDGWMQHILFDHLQGRLPSDCLCWFCDDIEFFAKDHGLDNDLRTNLENRMDHIRRHIVFDHFTVNQIRPDYHFLDHLHRCGLVTDEVYHQALCWHEPNNQMGGIFRYDYEPTEKVQARKRGQELVIDQSKEDRINMRRAKPSQRAPQVSARNRVLLHQKPIFLGKDH